MNMITLDDLPDEVLLKIFEFIGWKYRIKKIELVCKKWKQLLNFIYEHQRPISDIVLRFNECKSLNVSHGFYYDKIYLFKVTVSYEGSIIYIRSQKEIPGWNQHYYCDVEELESILFKIPFGGIATLKFEIPTHIYIRPIIEIFRNKCIKFSGYPDLMNDSGVRTLNYLQNIKHLELHKHSKLYTPSIGFIPSYIARLSINFKMNCFDLILTIMKMKNLTTLELYSHLEHGSVEIVGPNRLLRLLYIDSKDPIYNHYDLDESHFEECFGIILDVIKGIHSESKDFTLLMENFPNGFNFTKNKWERGKKSINYCRCSKAVVSNINLLRWKKKCKWHKINNRL